MIGHGKEKLFYYTIIRKSPTPSENRLPAILNQWKPKSVLGFEPNLLKQKANALPLAPPPQPAIHLMLIFRLQTLFHPSALPHLLSHPPPGRHRQWRHLSRRLLPKRTFLLGSFHPDSHHGSLVWPTLCHLVGFLWMLQTGWQMA